VPRPHRTFGDAGALACDSMASIIILYHRHCNRISRGVKPTQKRPWRWTMILECDTSNSLGTWTTFDSCCSAGDQPQQRTCRDVVGGVILPPSHAEQIKAFPGNKSLFFAENAHRGRIHRNCQSHECVQRGGCQALNWTATTVQSVQRKKVAA
jgi:hypothetical protein